ncbi:hypothetical protein P7C70_g9133, partial [Phenoliferia sp. Uapishka_3]
MSRGGPDPPEPQPQLLPTPKPLDELDVPTPQEPATPQLSPTKLPTPLSEVPEIPVSPPNTFEPDKLHQLLLDSQLKDEDIQGKIKLISTEEGDSSYKLVEGLLHYEDRVIVPDNAALKTMILYSRHDHLTAGHPGRTKTLKMIRSKYYWKGIKEYVDDYVDGCHKCQRVKTIRHKPYGLLKSLTVPDLPWTHLTMDFIDQLPESNGFDSIFVVVDRLTKMAIFINTTT